MRVEILGDERRRRWSDKSKLEVVLSVGVDSASVTEVARRYSVTRQQVYTWRRELRKKGLLSPRSTTVSAAAMPAVADSKKARAFDGMQVLPAMMELHCAADEAFALMAMLMWLAAPCRCSCR